MKKLRIKEYLNSRGITESELARKLGKSVQYVNGIVNERLVVSHAKIVHIARILGCKWTDLVTSDYVSELKERLSVQELKAV